MLWIVASLAGVTEVRSLIQLTWLNMLLQFTGFMIDQTDDPAIINHLLLVGFGLHAAIWIPIFISFFTVVSESKPPDAVYSIIVILFVLFSSFGILQVLKTRGIRVEVGYLILSLVSKTLLNWLYYGGIIQTRADF